MQPEAKKGAAEESGDLSLRRGRRFHLKKNKIKKVPAKKHQDAWFKICAAKMLFILEFLDKLGVFCMV